MTQKPLSSYDGSIENAGSLTTSLVTNRSGAELPLKIHSALVDAEHGRTRGTTTTVTSVSAPARQAQPSTPRRARILVADDEPRIRLALRSCLEAEGYELHEAADGNEALDAVVRFAPDLLILDLAMPNLDGMRTLSELRDLHGQLKPRVIVLTAWGSDPVMLKVIGLGAELYLEKPLDPETLRRAVKVVLERQKEVREIDGIPIDWSEAIREETENDDLGGLKN